ncbi:MAG: glutamate--tRNA ligase [candidate division WOR-3 bacterium]|nr:MAG: glutamate--tRNA ligase [candidate division WOR-3 bacterium]
MKDEVRVRIAPSPTGFFHMGSARTALYNWFFARHNNGKFVLRVEDTDVVRSSAQMIDVILDGLKWLGIDWDEGPFFQSERISVYQKYVQILIDKGCAYYCYCNPNDLEQERQAAYKRKEDWQYDRRCLGLSESRRQEKEEQKVPRVVRFLVPDEPVSYCDLVHGEIKREAKDIEDLIILRSNGVPTYNLACVVDDHEMNISHVIRAVDHITNTPKQILLLNALALPVPKYAHLPLILGEDKSKLSKRHGAASLMEYRKQGYLPEAVLNYLALLGWSPGNDQEMMSIETLIKEFDLGRINPSNAVFDGQKLEWMNGQYIYAMSDEELCERLTPFILEFGLLKRDEILARRTWLLKVCGLIKLRLKTFADIKDVAGYFFVEDFEYEDDGVKKHCNAETIEILEGFLSHLDTVKPYDAQAIEQAVRNYAQAGGIKAGRIIHPLRFSVTGKQGGPGLFETMELVGKEKCLKRMRRFVDGFKKE